MSGSFFPGGFERVSWDGASRHKTQKEDTEKSQSKTPRQGSLPDAASPSEMGAPTGHASLRPLSFSCSWADPGPERPQSYQGILFGGNNASAGTWANTAPHQARADLSGRGVTHYTDKPTGSQALQAPFAQKNIPSCQL